MTGIKAAEIVIVGGGIIGCSIAYHLTRMGRTDVVILEKSGLTHGATWHAAGLVGQLRTSRNTTRMLQRSVELYDKLEAETGQAIDWKKVGSLRLAGSAERLLELKRAATMAKSFGLDMQLIGPKEAQALFDTNFFGVMNVIRHVVPKMREQRSGTIVNVSSLAGVVTAPFVGTYSASKRALEAASEALYFELHPYGVRVLLVEPGGFETNIENTRRMARRFTEGSPLSQYPSGETRFVWCFVEINILEKYHKY